MAVTISEIEQFKHDLGLATQETAVTAAHLAQEFHRLLRGVERNLHWDEISTAQNGALRGARSSETAMLQWIRPSGRNTDWWASFVRSGTSGANQLIFVLSSSAA